MSTRSQGSALSRLTRFVGAENLSLIIALLLLVLAVSSQTEFLFSSRNIFNIAQNMARTQAGQYVRKKAVLRLLILLLRRCAIDIEVA